MLSPHSTYILRTTKLSIFSSICIIESFGFGYLTRAFMPKGLSGGGQLFHFIWVVGLWLSRPEGFMVDLKTNLRVLKSNTRHKKRLDFVGLPLLKPFHHHSLTSPWTITLTFRDGKKFSRVRGSEVLYIEYRM